MTAAALTVVFCGLCLALNAAGFSLAAKAFKMAASFSFIATAWLAGARHSTYGWVLFAGLIASSFGDYFLLAPTDSRFLAGLVSFFIAHVAYCVAYAVRGTRLPGAAVAGAAMVIASVFVVRWVWPHVPSDMKIPVAAYVAVISTMVALAGGTISKPGGRLILLGAVMFYISDVFVARQQFVAPGSINAIVGLPLYFGGQAVLALSIAQVNAAIVGVTDSDTHRDPQ